MMPTPKHSKPRPDIGLSAPGTEPAPEAIRDEIRNRALGLLARREHSRVELVGKLAGRGFPAADIETVLDELTEEKLQSDTRFAESYLYARVQRGQGPHRIRAELCQRGVDDVIIEQVVTLADTDWFELAREAWRKRFGMPAEDYAGRAKQARFLQNRGFGHEHIQYALETGKKER